MTFYQCLNSSFILQQHIIDPVRKALDYYTEMEKALEREKQNRAQSENGTKSKESSVSTLGSHAETVSLYSPGCINTQREIHDKSKNETMASAKLAH